MWNGLAGSAADPTTVSVVLSGMNAGRKTVSDLTEQQSNLEKEKLREGGENARTAVTQASENERARLKRLSDEGAKAKETAEKNRNSHIDDQRNANIEANKNAQHVIEHPDVYSDVDRLAAATAQDQNNKTISAIALMRESGATPGDEFNPSVPRYEVSPTFRYKQQAEATKLGYEASVEANKASGKGASTTPSDKVSFKEKAVGDLSQLSRAIVLEKGIQERYGPLAAGEKPADAAKGAEWEKANRFVEDARTTRVAQELAVAGSYPVLMTRLASGSEDPAGAGKPSVALRALIQNGVILSEQLGDPKFFDVITRSARIHSTDGSPLAKDFLALYSALQPNFGAVSYPASDTPPAIPVQGGSVLQKPK